MRRWIWPAVLYAGITLAMTWPLVLRLGSVIPHDTGDPVLSTWILWWSTRQVPLTAAWWNAPMFFPMANAMALSELYIGLLPLTAVVQAITANPIAAYNVAFLLSFPLCGLAAALLAFELTRQREAAVVAGLAFAFAPYRIGQLAHLQMLSYYWAPVALLALHGYLRSHRTPWLALFAGAWLLQALTNGYALFHLSVLVAMWVLWFMRPWRTAIPVIAAWACAALPLVPILLKYREVHRFLHLTRDINEIKRFGADLSGFGAASADALVWGSRLFTSSAETALFPGITVLAAGAVAAVLFLRAPTPGQRSWTTMRRTCAAVAAGAAAVAASVLIVGPWSIDAIVTVGEPHKPLSIAAAAAILFAASSPLWRTAWRERSVPMFYVAAMAAMYVLALGPAPLAWGHPVLYEPPYAWLMRLPGIEELRVPARFAMLGVLCSSTLLAIAVARWR